MTPRKIGLINLGCSRNLVDSQTMLGELKKEGHRITAMDEADVAIVNTCAFIEEAKQESIDTILDLIALKKQGKLKKVIVAGCLAQRYGKELAKEIPEIDELRGVLKLNREKVPARFPLTPRHFAYVKICESCYNQCSFCVIPKIKGKFISRALESILAEVRMLDAEGVKEIMVIGQDITAYGMDIYRHKMLAKLLREITKITRNIEWIRLLYTFPAHVTDELIDTIAEEEKICKYIDMPLQHISDPILKSMKRGITTKGTLELLEKIRTNIPQASIRTTFIVGLPGETPQDFVELFSFVQEQRFEKMGVFVYSREEGTPAYTMPNQVPDRVKKKRLHTLMQVQQEISKELQEKRMGETFKVMIDEASKEEKDIYLGRSQYDAPEVDGVVFVHSSQRLNPGEFVQVRITGSYEYDLVGEVV